MKKNYQDHHENQNAITEVEVPQPHQPGFEPARGEKLASEADALYEGLGMGAYFPSSFGDDDMQDSNTGSNAFEPDMDAFPDDCGCPREPRE